MPLSKPSTLSVLHEKVGFRFDESELSPALRKRLGEVSTLEEQIEGASHQVDDLNTRKDESWLWVVILAVGAGILLIFTFSGVAYLILGLGLVVVAAAFHDTKVKPLERELAEKKRDLAVIATGYEGELGKISREIFQQLSDVHEAKVHPKVAHFVVDFARIIEATHGRGLLLQSMQCPNCQATVSLPKEGESFQCNYCGRTIHAVDVFDKLRASLNLRP